MERAPDHQFADGWPVVFRDKRDPGFLRELVYAVGDTPVLTEVVPLRPLGDASAVPDKSRGTEEPKPPRRTKFLETALASVRWAWLELFEKRNTWAAPFRLIGSYRKWLSTLIYATMLVSLFSGIVVQTLLTEYFAKELNSPNLRHVVVSDNIYRRDTQLNETNLDDWNEKRPWAASCSTSLPSRESSGNAYATPAFGRLTVSAQLTPDAETSRNREHPVSILVAAPSEPLLRDIPIYDLDGRPANRSLLNLFEAADEPGIIVDRTYLATLRKEFGIDPSTISQVEIWLSRGYDKVRLLGMVDRIPYDRAHTHNAMISQRNYALWLSQSDPDKLVNGKKLAQGFERVVFYFSPGDFDCIFRFLLAKEFDFNKDNFEKFGDLMRLTERFSTLVDLIVVFSFAVIGFVVGLTTGKIITENQTGLAVLLAHGAGRATLLPFVGTLIVTQWALAVILFYGLLLTVLGIGGTTFALFSVDPFKLLFDASVAWLIIKAIGLSLLLGLCIVAAWMSANRNMAGRLREG